MTRPQRLRRLRAALRARYGAQRYAVDGDLVRVYVPQVARTSSRSGWYVLGPIGMAEALLGLSSLA